jgi:inorganic triphosphatase YgiF
MMEVMERELKLRPANDELLDRLEQTDQLGPLRVSRRWRESQRNAYFDTPDGALARSHVSLRRRAVQGQKQAIWTSKGPSTASAGITSRPEIEVTLDPDTPVGQAIGLLARAARERGAPLIADALRDAPAVPPEPKLELVTDRRLADLELSGGGRAELALDRVALVGHPDYCDREIEVELKRGEESLLSTARTAIEAIGDVSESDGSKLSRALAYLGQARLPAPK